MLNDRRINLVMFIGLLLIPSFAWSGTLYISDQLVVSLRELPQENSKAITYLKTDTPVELIEDGKAFAKVKTANGEIGYIQKGYLVERLPKPVINNRLTRENERLNGRIRELEAQYKEAFTSGDETRARLVTEVEELRAQAGMLQTELNDSNKKLAEVSKAYETLTENSKDIVAITDERNQLKLSYNELSVTLNNLEQERNLWLRNGIIKWFLAGGGVLFVGWVLGKFSKPRRKSSLY